MTARIIDRGRGPEIEGTRITVYDVMDYWCKGWQHDQIACPFRLPADDIQAAVRYIETHFDLARVVKGGKQTVAATGQEQGIPR